MGVCIASFPACVTVVFICRCLVQDTETRCALYGCSQPRGAFEKVVTAIGQQNTRLNNLKCKNDHSFMKTLARMAGSLYNIFTSNYAAELNSDIHASRGYQASPATTRNKDRDKLSKLSSAKKR